MLRTIPILFFLYLCPLIAQLSISHAYFFYEEQADEKKEEPAEASQKSLSAYKKTQRSEIKIAAPTNSFMQKNNDLKRYLSKNEAQPLLVGTEEYVIVEETSSTPNNKGVVILLPDWQQGLTSPKAINFLRKQLPLIGWSTISIQPPNMPTNYPLLMSDKKAQLESNNELLKNYQTKLKMLMVSVMAKAKNYPGVFLVITQGSNAAMLTQLYKEDNTLLPSAMIMLSASMYTSQANEAFANNMAISDLPTLDLILKRDSKNILENAILRKKLATKELKISYRQRQLHNVYTGYYPEQTLLTEIVGWLKTIGW